MSHAYGERGRAAGAIEQGLLAYGVRESCHLGGGDLESPGTDGGGGGGGGLANDAGGAVDGEIDSGLQDGGGDHGHDGDHGLGHHAAVADHASFGFMADELGGGAA